MSNNFQQSQRQFTAHIRNPTDNPGPADVEDRRMAIYRDLIYNNIESFIVGGFPVLREIHNDTEWHNLIREFIVQHQCHSPYFLEISQEFVTYLQQRPIPENKPFLLELAHYEWVELALDCSTEVFPDDVSTEGDLLEMHPVVSPLAWNLSYQFPVHQISLEFQPTVVPTTPSFLVVYRNRQDKVGFMEANAATNRLLALLVGEPQLTGRQALALLAEELSAPNPQAIIDFGSDILHTLQKLDIICGLR